MDTPQQPTYRRSEQEPCSSDQAQNHQIQQIYEMSVKNCRRLDELAINKFGIPSIVLMENAAIALKESAQEMIKGELIKGELIKVKDRPSVHLFCGPGNNAGDGFALARHLSNHQIKPTVIMTHDSDRYLRDAKTNLEIITKMNIERVDAQSYLAQKHDEPIALMVDALFGTGLTRAIEGVAADLVHHINQRPRSLTKVLAVDVPSGLDAQSGQPMGSGVVEADRTLTFAALKDGFREIDAQAYLGEVMVADIGIPRSLIESLGRRISANSQRP